MEVKTRDSILDDIINAIEEAAKNNQVVDEIVLTKNEAIALYKDLNRWKWLDWLDIFSFDFFLDLLEEGFIFNGVKLKYEKEVSVD